MGLDESEKVLADYNEVFADIINGFLFGGRQVILPENLENSGNRSQYKAKGKLHQQERDVSKYYRNKEVRVAFLGLENQTDEDGAMPLRIISYDGASYRSQLIKADTEARRLRKSKRKKGKRIKKAKYYPVVSLVLYFGTTHWKQATTLREALEITDELDEFVSDYKIHVMEVAFLTPEQVKMFRSDFRLVADFFVQKRLKGDYIPPNIPIQHVDEFLKLLEVLVGEKRYEEILKEMQVNGYYKDGETTMCEIYDQIYNKGVAAERVKTEAERKKRLKERNRANRLAVENKNQKEEIRRLRKLLGEKA